MVTATTTPERFTSGDTVKWLRSESSYLPADGWVLSAMLVSSDYQQAITSADNGDGRHLFTLSAADSASLPAGKYNLQIYASKSGERFTLESRQVDVVADFATASSGVDARSQAQKIIEAIDAVMANKATADQAGYSIAGRSLQRLPPSELLQMRKHYQRIYDAELRKAAISRGEKAGIVRVRF